MKGNLALTEEEPKWPRITIHNIDSTTLPEELPTIICNQNPHLGEDHIITDQLKQIFKRGPRERPTVNWVIEVHQNLLNNMLSRPLYIGFSRCRVDRFEEVTQCYKCLKFGHPSAQCNITLTLCGHCAGTGHLQKDCPKAEEEPKCANCRGKHSALDRSCTSRLNAVANRLQRTAVATQQ